MMSPVELSLFASRLEAVCDEMGGVLRNAAFSPNIRDRLDFSCAVFDDGGQICAQAAHIPVHLGSMAFAIGDVVSRVAWAPGDMVVFNDPFLGGTHLPDVTIVAPLFLGADIVAFVVNRAHHADIGAQVPGSMPVSSSLDEEGLVLEPVHLVRGGEWQAEVLARIESATADPAASRGDFAAQVSANRAGLARLEGLVERAGRRAFGEGLGELNDYGERLARAVLREIPDGTWTFEDRLADDGQGPRDLPIRVRIDKRADELLVDFSGTVAQVRGNVNCPVAVAAAAVYYCFRCLMPRETPACAGAFRPVRLHAPDGSLLNARFPAAVAAGNVETSSRVVDVVLGALAQAIPDRIPAASQGTMNNLAMGSSVPERRWDYYETLGGGMGSGIAGGGLDAVQTHMTNTLNTPVEVLESRFPLVVREYGIRRHSGGSGVRRGGDGLVREFEFLSGAEVSLLTERRDHAPWGMSGGGSGQPGLNLLNGERLPPKCHRHVRPGDRLRIETPGGGGYGGSA